MEEIKIPMGVTCHNERDENGKWWIVWGVDFDNEPGQKPHPESCFLEDAFKAGRKTGGDYMEGYDDGAEWGIKLVAEDIEFFDHAYSDTEWGDKQFRKSVVAQLKKGWLNEKV